MERLKCAGPEPDTFLCTTGRVCVLTWKQSIFHRAAIAALVLCCWDMHAVALAFTAQTKGIDTIAILLLISNETCHLANLGCARYCQTA